MCLALFPAAHSVCALSVNVTTTARPNWALGNPQPVQWSACSAAVAGLCGAGIEDADTPKLLGNPITYIASDIVAEALAGDVGSDVCVPTAFWVRPAAFWWVDGGLFGGGMLAFFNSIVGGVAYANEAIIYDPIDENTTFGELEALDLQLGGSGLLPYPVTTTINSDRSINASIPGFTEAPEPASIAPLGIGCIGIALIRTLRRRAR